MIRSRINIFELFFSKNVSQIYDTLNFVGAKEGPFFTFKGTGDTAESDIFYLGGNATRGTLLDPDSRGKGPSPLCFDVCTICIPRLF